MANLGENLVILYIRAAEIKGSILYFLACLSVVMHASYEVLKSATSGRCRERPYGSNPVEVGAKSAAQKDKTLIITLF